jgi:hypothetical protein
MHEATGRDFSRAENAPKSTMGFQPPHKANMNNFGFSRGGRFFAYFAQTFRFFRSLLSHYVSPLFATLEQDYP